jgi:hypothetical protein
MDKKNGPIWVFTMFVTQWACHILNWMVLHIMQHNIKN